MDCDTQGIDELMREAKEINAKTKEWCAKVAAWNAKQKQLSIEIYGPLSFFPQDDWLLGKTIRPEPLYRATRDGWTLANFHEKVDNKGATLLMARTNISSIVGGYTSISWSKGMVRWMCIC